MCIAESEPGPIFPIMLWWRGDAAAELICPTLCFPLTTPVNIALKQIPAHNFCWNDTQHHISWKVQSLNVSIYAWVACRLWPSKSSNHCFKMTKRILSSLWSSYQLTKPLILIMTLCNLTKYLPWSMKTKLVYTFDISKSKFNQSIQWRKCTGQLLWYLYTVLNNMVLYNNSA